MGNTFPCSAAVSLLDFGPGTRRRVADLIIDFHVDDCIRSVERQTDACLSSSGLANLIRIDVKI